MRYLLIFLLLCSSCQGLLYAQSSAAAEVVLEQLETKIDTALDMIEQKVDPEIKVQINEKQEEIGVFLDQQQEKLANTDSVSEQQAIIQEAKQIVALKAIAGITPEESITDSIATTIETSAATLGDAKEVLIESVVSDDSITILIASTASVGDITTRLQVFDLGVVVKLLYEDGNEYVYEVITQASSNLAKELLGDAETGELPTHLLGYRVIQPELLQIGQLQLQGEQQEKLRGISSYSPQSYYPLIATPSNKLRIGIIDTGIDDTHPDLQAVVKKSQGWNFIDDSALTMDDQGHGTHIAGTIAGQINGQGVYGINPYVELIPLKICDAKGFCPSYAVLKSLSFAKEKQIDILNMSLGAKGNPLTSPVCDGIRELSKAGAIVVSAAGNSNIDTIKFVPGGCRYAITVGAVDSNMQRASFSNYGSKVDVSAPGVQIYSSYPNNSYKYLNGTSMATPHIVGIVSIMKQLNPNLQTPSIKKIFEQFSTKITTEEGKVMKGFFDLGGWLGSASQAQSSTGAETTTGVSKAGEQPEEKKQEPVPAPTADTAPTESNQALPVTIDESIGLVIQQPEETTKINSVEEQLSSSDQEETVINNVGDEVGTLDPNLIYEEDVTKINSDETLPIEFGTNDVLEEEAMEINSADPKEAVSAAEPSLVGDAVAHEGSPIQELIVDESQYPEEVEQTGDNTAIQGTYYCNIQFGQYCEYYIYAASTYSFFGATSSIPVYKYSNSIRVYGNGAGSTILRSYKNGYYYDTIYVNVVQPLRNLSIAYNSSQLHVGQSSNVWVTNGNGGYSAWSSNTNVVSLAGQGSSWTYSARNSGTATIYVRDSKGKQTSFLVTVIQPLKNLRASISPSSLIEKDASVQLSISDGNGGYSVWSSNPNIFSVGGSNTNWTLYGKTPGTATVYVRDQRGKEISAGVTVYAKSLQLDVNSLTMELGKNGYINILKGNGGYTISRNNNNVQLYANGINGFRIYGATPGTSLVQIKDSAGKSQTVQVTVVQPLKNLSISHTSLGILNGSSVNFSILQGNGGYTVTSSDISIATVVGSNTNRSVSAKKPGTTTIVIKDSKGKQISLPVTVSAKNLVLSTNKITIEQGTWGSIWSVVQGNPPYSYAMNNGNASRYWSNSSIPSFINYGNTIGTTILQVRDSAGKVASVEVVVKEKPKAKIVIVNEWYDLYRYGVGGIQFKVTGVGISELQEVGVEFVNDLGQIERGTVMLQPDGEYIVAYSETSCVKCKNFKPYVIQKGGSYIANFEDIGDVEGTEIAGWNDFAAQITNLFYARELDVTLNKKVADVSSEFKELQKKYGDYASLVVSLIPLVGEGYDLTSIFIGKDPITQEKLNPFQKKITVIGLISGAGSGPAARKIVDETIGTIANKYGLTTSEVYTIANEVTTYFRLNSIEDFAKNLDQLKLENFKRVVSEKASALRLDKLIKTIKWSTVSKPDLSKINNEFLKKTLSEDYRDAASIGNGSTADAIRYELKTGLQVGGKRHSQKGQDIMNSIQKRFNADDLNAYDKKIATDVFTDIKNALNGN